MAYDLFVTENPAPPAEELDTSAVLWEWFGTYGPLWLARVAITMHGQQQPRLQRWRLFYHRGTLHSSGTYDRKEP